MIQGVYSLTDALLEGRSQFTTFRKQPAVVTVQGSWYDLSMAPGNPAPQYYIGSIATSTAMARSSDGGIYHGHAVTPYQKLVHRLTVMSSSATSLPLTFVLCDYLLFYPFIDESTTDAQEMLNTVALPRYTDGEGVQMMAVVVAGQTGGQTFQVTYTNSDGVAGRTTTVVTQGTTAVNGTIITTMQATAGCAGPFLPLQEGDTGVLQVDSVQMISGTDVGLFTIVLVKPLATMRLREQTAPVEREFWREFASAPVVKDDAYLNLIVLPTGSMSGVGIHGIAEFLWS